MQKEVIQVPTNWRNLRCPATRSGQPFWQKQDNKVTKTKSEGEIYNNIEVVNLQENNREPKQVAVEVGKKWGNVDRVIKITT